MATFITSKNLCISVDPGFNATKVVVNGLIFEIPNAVLDVTGKTNEFLELGGASKRTPGYLVSRYVPNKEYLVGELARRSLTEKSERNAFKVKSEMMDSKNRFETSDFQVNLMTCIGAAIIKYANESVRRKLKPEIHLENPNELASFRVFVGVALPNDWVNDIWPTIENYLIGQHNYSVDTEEGSYELNFKIEEKHAMATSQAIAALIGTAYDDNGDPIPNAATLKDLPAVILDGGYKTIGLFQLTKANRVAAAESNTDFAMDNIHKEVARIIREDYGREQIESFMIPSIIEGGGKLNYLALKNPMDENNKTTVSRTVDVTKIRDKVQRDVCEKLIEYMDEKFDNFLDIRQIIITGGTGSAYYKQMVEYFNEQREFLQGKVILTDYEFLGAPIDPVYGVAVGLYKILKNQIAKALKRSNLEGETVVEVTTSKAKPETAVENNTDKIKNKPVNRPVQNVEE